MACVRACRDRDQSSAGEWKEKCSSAWELKNEQRSQQHQREKASLRLNQVPDSAEGPSF